MKGGERLLEDSPGLPRVGEPAFGWPAALAPPSRGAKPPT